MRAFVLSTIFLLSTTAAFADEAEKLPPPTGEEILTVTGAISRHNRGDAAVFDIDLLKEVGETTMVTSTIWTDGVKTWTGVPLDAVMDFVGSRSDTVEAVALNDYRVELPVDDPLGEGPILAYAMDDTRLTVRDKGPLWIIYPFDANDGYTSALYLARAVWQLSELHVTP